MDCSRYSGHSFRIGAATTAIARGVPESTVQMLGRWESDPFKRYYIRIPRQDLAQISKKMATDYIVYVCVLVVVPTCLFISA